MAAWEIVAPINIGMMAGVWCFKAPKMYMWNLQSGLGRSYNCSTQVSATIAPMAQDGGSGMAPYCRQGALVGDNIYYAGGSSDQDNFSQGFWKYSISGNTHTQLADLPDPMSSVWVCPDGNGGVLAGPPQASIGNTIFRYNPGTNSWSTWFSVGFTADLGFMAQLGPDGKIYLKGGDLPATHCRIDVNEVSVEVLAAPPNFGRSASGPVNVGSQIWWVGFETVAGGELNDPPVLVFDTGTQSFLSDLAVAPTEGWIKYPAVCLYNGRVWAMGGQLGFFETAQVQRVLVDDVILNPQNLAAVLLPGFLPANGS